MRYKVIEAQDGTFWVPLQPLLMDLNDHIQKIEDKNVTHGLQIVESFMKALLQEGTINKYAQKNLA